MREAIELEHIESLKLEGLEIRAKCLLSVHMKYFRF